MPMNESPGQGYMGGGGMSMRNPMSRAPMNNNPMGYQAPMQLQTPSTPEARNVLMGQPRNANTAMRPLNMPGMQFDPNTNAMVRMQRPTRGTMDPAQAQAMINRARPISGGNRNMTDERRASIMATRLSRAGRMAGVRGQDMAEWRRTSPIALAIRNREANAQMAMGPQGGQPAQMGANQMAIQGPPEPPPQKAVSPAVVTPATPRITLQPESEEAKYQRDRDEGYYNEALALQNEAGMSLADMAYRSAKLGAKRIGSEIRDGAQAIIQGRPQDAEQARERNQINRLMELNQNDPQAPEPPIALGRLSELNVLRQDPTEAFLQKFQGKVPANNTPPGNNRIPLKQPIETGTQLGTINQPILSKYDAWRSRFREAGRQSTTAPPEMNQVPQMRSANSIYATDGVSPYLQRAVSAMWRQFGY
jgi:hypothetical protein